MFWLRFWWLEQYLKALHYRNSAGLFVVEISSD